MSNSIKLNAFQGPCGLTDAALHFAQHRLESAARMVRRANNESNVRRVEIRKAFAVKALQDAQQQLQAAIALLTMDLES
jgi:hypothetical protein